MAQKKIYFYKAILYDEYGAIASQELFKNIIIEILNRYGIDQEECISIDITPHEESMHLIFDAYNYKNEKLFGRFSRQLPKNSLVHHEYRTYTSSDVLPGVDEKERGIEKYTYGMLNYVSGIFAFVSSQGATSEKALKILIEKYKPGYTLDLISIPNERGIERIYEGKDPEISKVEIEVPLPDAAVLESLFGWKDAELLKSLSENKLRISTVLKSEPRNNLTDEPGIVQKVIDAVKEGKNGYNKAKMVARAKSVKAREYNFFDDNFMYPIDIAPYHMQNNERIYYTAQELVDIYMQNITLAFNESKGILDLFRNNN